MLNNYTAGNKGQKVRSDCFVTLALTEKGGLIIDIQSKVKALYGQRIKDLAEEILNYFGILNAHIVIEDEGALDFVLAARIESAIKQAVNTDLEFLLPFKPVNDFKPVKERERFSRLYLPGNSPAMMLNAGIHKPNAIILDLEDSVAPDKKHEAGLLVRNALREVNFFGAERMVRINQIPQGLKDLSYIIPHNVNLILLPKCEKPEDISTLEKEIEKLKVKHNVSNDICLMPIIESALGVENAFTIAKSSKNIVGLAIGLEDYTADLGVQRTQPAWESFYARTRIVNACKAAGIQAIDSVFSDVADMEGLKETIKVSKSLGFEGMGCIHPRQIGVIHEGYAPNEAEIEKAEKIVNAFIIAGEMGLGVVSLGTKMIDPPVVKRAQKIIDLALKLNLTDKNWRNKYVG
ncbi:MAG: HpcH/HpaI aldolase/citrate lyase family protein [Bacteroidales bacterium]|nr:HpcH/HpaI aldolase/citrate lyase family protein [Bacteroidales bacterium]